MAQNNQNNITPNNITPKNNTILKNIGSSLQNGIDRFFKAFGKTTSAFVASLFLIFTLGSLYGFVIAHSPNNTLLLIIPPILGIIAYYSRVFAILIAIFFLLVFVL